MLRCPTCSASLQRDAEAIACTVGHTVPMIDDDLPDLAGVVSQTDSAGQRLMRFGPLVRIYERLWRPAFTALAGGRDPGAETAALFDRLTVAADATLLDVACGPGNTTRRLARGVPDGRVLGVDLSAPMLRRAIAEPPTVAAAVAYARADAHHLAIADESIDGAHCAAALYLVSDPGAVVAEIARVLRPGAVFAGMTIVAPLSIPMPITAAVTGMRYVSAERLAQYCAEARLEAFEAERRGGALLFSARRPAA